MFYRNFLSLNVLKNRFFFIYLLLFLLPHVSPIPIPINTSYYEYGLLSKKSR